MLWEIPLPADCRQLLKCINLKIKLMLELDLSKSESLSEGSFLDLNKYAIKIAQVGLGWKTNEDPNGPNFDLDVSAFLLNADGKVPGLGYVVFHKSKNKNEDGRPYSEDGSVLGSIDVIGDEEEDDEDEGGDKEDIIIYFEHVSPIIHEIAIAVSISIYPNDAHRDPRTKDLNFGMVNNSYIHMWDADTMVEIFRYDLKKNFSSEQAVLFGKFKRTPNNQWEFLACGDGCQGDLNSLGKMLKFF